MDDLELEPVQDNQPLDLEPLDLEPIEAPEKEPSTLSDVGRAITQGLTFGFSDELIAALKTPELAKLFWTLPGEDSAKKFQEAGEKYRAQQEIEQRKISEARERSPIAYTAGEIAGGVLPALFTGGTSAAATATKAAPFLPSLLKATKAGAAYGAIAAAGTTEKPIQETGEFLGEVGKGALAGGTIGAGLSTLGRAGKALLPDVEDIQGLRQAKLSYERGKEGIPSVGEKAVEKQVGIREPKVAFELEKQILDTRDVLGKKIDDVLTLAEGQGVTIGGDKLSKDSAEDILSIITSKPGIFGRDLGEDLATKASKLSEGSLSPKEANELRKVVRDKLVKISDRGDIETSEILERVKDSLQNKLNEIEGFSQANKDYTTFLRSTAETIFKKGTPIEAIETSLSEVAKPKEKLFNDLLTLIRKSEKPGASADEQKRTLVALRENLASIENERPGFLKSIGFDPEKFVSTLKSEADVSAVSQIRRGYQPQTGEVKQFFGLVTPRAASYAIAETAGKAVGAIKKSTPVKLASKVYSAAEPELRRISDALISNPSTRRFGENLASSLEKPSGVASRAILFSIMQDPGAREVISSIYPGIGEEQ